MQWKTCDHQLFLSVIHSKQCTNSRYAPKDHFCNVLYMCCKQAWTELFPCVKRLFISAENDRRNTVDFRPSSSFLQETQHYLRHSEYLYHGVLQVRRSKHYAVFFISLWSWETVLIKTYLSPTEQHGI